MRVTLNPPLEVKAKHERDVANVRQIFKSNKARLGKAKRKKLDASLRRMIEAYDQGSSGLKAKLRRLSDFFDGKEEAVDFPFGPDASSNIDLRLAAGMGRMMRAQFVRSVFSDPLHSYVMVDVPGFKKEELNQVERAVNYLAENRDNLNEELKDTFIPSYRDGTAPVYGEWERRIERGFEYRVYTDPDAFLSDYPDADTAGVSEVEFEEITQYLQDPDAELHVEYQTDFVSRNGPKFTAFPLAKFIFYPFYQSQVSDLSIYGFSYTENKGKFEHNAKNGYYDSDVVDEVRKKTPESRMDRFNSWDAQAESTEGLSDMAPAGISYNLAWLCYCGDLDDDGVEERYSVIYDLDHNKSLRVEYYGLPRNVSNIVPMRLIRKTGRLLGDILLLNGEPLFREINALHRHRSNTRRLTDSVTLLMPERLKDVVDLGAEYGSFRPGLTMWVPDQYMNPVLAPRQIAITGTSRTNESVDEESFVQRYIDILIGGSPGQSGRESPVDPNAPASKTAMLLGRADMRLEDLIDEWRRTIPAILDLYIALYVKNASSDISVMSQRGESSSEETIPLEIFSRPGLKGVLKPVKPATEPAQEMNKYAALAVGAMKFTVPIQLKPEILVHLWNEYVSASRIERPERFQIELQGDGQMAMGGQAVGQDRLAAMVQQMTSGQQPGAPTNGSKPLAAIGGQQ